MEMLGTFFSLINQLLYLAYLMVSYIFQAFGISWIGFVVGLVVISAVLRLFVANLVGSSIFVHDQREFKQYKERQKARSGNSLSKSKSGKG